MKIAFAVVLLAVLWGCRPKAAESVPQLIQEAQMSEEKKVAKTKEEWKKLLPADTFRVMCNEDTEAPFTGKYWNNHEQGKYVCAACGLELFESDTKFDSGTGWPSFYAPVKKENIGEKIDEQYGMRRVEVHCPRCGGHLGHLFPDGPKPTGMRYCINSASLDFKKKP